MNFSRCSSVLYFAFAVLLLTTSARGQVVFLEDFEGPLPGVIDNGEKNDGGGGFPGGWAYFGDGEGGEVTSLNVVKEITDEVAFTGVQSYRINLDSSAITSYWYYGQGGFLGWNGEGFGAGGGQPGAKNPANYVVSFDINIEGVVSGDEVVGGNITLYKADYEETYGVDLNNDGELTGYNLWSSDFSTNIGQTDGWVHVEWNLASGTAPTVPQTNGVSYFTEPVFNDEAVFQYGFFPFNSPAGFGNDADNVILVDNLQLEFIPPVLGPGDFDGDGDVDGEDFLAWQRGESPTPLSSEDLTTWRDNYGTGAALASFAAVPEPGSLLLAATSAILLLGRRRRS